MAQSASAHRQSQRHRLRRIKFVARFQIGHTPRKFPASTGQTCLATGSHLPHQRISAQSCLSIIPHQKVDCKYFLTFYSFSHSKYVPFVKPSAFRLFFGEVLSSKPAITVLFPPLLQADRIRDKPHHTYHIFFFPLTKLIPFSSKLSLWVSLYIPLLHQRSVQNTVFY